MNKLKHDDNYYIDLIRYNIKRIRNERRLTQQILADLSGISMNYLAKIESNKMKRGLSIVTLGRIADALNISIKEFFNDLEDNEE